MPREIFPSVPPARRALMARVRAKDSKPEMAVRRAAHALGYRFRLHRRDLPGTPDLVFPRLRKAVLVHGCFWHRHPRCPRTTTPKTRADYWNRKFEENVARDAARVRELEALGWGILVIWECETKPAADLQARLSRFLNPGGPSPVERC
ncbi:MAG: very short patch repair endonuclease [Allosphingosinicella sp.]|uniref:very short patch repair endonuclease n=1 Tax=Allosphingosinicella sp. TaxID=2823234 RepID=UPI00395BBEBD